MCKHTIAWVIFGTITVIFLRSLLRHWLVGVGRSTGNRTDDGEEEEGIEAAPAVSLHLGPSVPVFKQRHHNAKQPLPAWKPE